MGSSFAPFYQAWVRSIVIMLLMLPILIATKSFRAIERRDWPKLAVFIGFCVCTQVPLYYAFNHAPIGTVQLIFYAMFVIAAYIMGRLYVGEHITRIKLLSMAVAFVGLALVFGVSVFAFAPLGLLLAAANGIASGSENASSKKLTDKYAPGLIIFWGWAFTLLTHLPLSLLLHEPQPRPAFTAGWGYLLCYSIFNAAAFWLGIQGYKYVDASIGSLLGLMEILFAVVFAAIVFHQHITWIIAVGGVLIIVAATLPDMLAIIQHRRLQQPIEPVREE